jgi:hypothetical protein
MNNGKLKVENEKRPELSIKSYKGGYCAILIEASLRMICM